MAHTDVDVNSQQEYIGPYAMCKCFPSMEFVTWEEFFPSILQQVFVPSKLWMIRIVAAMARCRAGCALGLGVS